MRDEYIKGVGVPRRGTRKTKSLYQTPSKVNPRLEGSVRTWY